MESIRLSREMLCKLDQQIQTEEKEVDDRIQRLDTIVYKNGFLFIRSSFLQTTSDGKNKQEEYHRLTAQRIAQEKERLSTREQELHQQVRSDYVMKHRLQSRRKLKRILQVKLKLKEEKCRR